MDRVGKLEVYHMLLESESKLVMGMHGVPGYQGIQVCTCKTYKVLINRLTHFRSDSDLAMDELWSSIVTVSCTGVREVSLSLCTATDDLMI